MKQGRSETPFYVTTAIAYPNGARRTSGTPTRYIATDAIARFKRLDGFDVRFLTGTDEHGLKMAQTAAAEGLPTAELARRNSDAFQRLDEMLNISFDRFIRTTDPTTTRPRRRSGSAWPNAATSTSTATRAGIPVPRRTVLHRGRDQRRPRQRQVATETGTPVTWTEEQTYFFRLSAYAGPLLAHYAANPDFIAPEVRRNEVISFVSGGLRDLSVSRTSFDWGVPVPGDPARHVRLGRR